MKQLMVLPLVALAFALLAPAAQADDPDIPASGDACGTTAALSPGGAVGTVGDGDSEDWYQNPNNTPLTVEVQPLAEGETILFQSFNSDCDLADGGNCRFAVHNFGKCGLGGIVLGLQSGDLPGREVTIPANGFLRLANNGTLTPYTVTTVEDLL